MSSTERRNINHDNLDIDSIIAKVKQEFKNFFIQREQLIITLGKAFERIVSKPESICREIKGTLREEIAQGLITTRAIELHCPDEWKKKTRPKKEKNENLSISQEEQQAAPLVLVDASGNSEIESVAISDADPNNIVVNYEGRPPDVENLNTDASLIGKDLEEIIKKSASFITADQQLSEQATVVELKTKIERLQSDLQSKSDENSTLHIQVKDLRSKLEACAPHSNQEDKSFYAPFQYPYDPLQRYMASLFKKYIRYVSFIAKVDPVTKRILNVQIHEENSDSE